MSELHVLVTPDGAITTAADIDGPPPTLAPNKGAWLPVREPVYNPATHVAGPHVVAPDGASVTRNVRRKTRAEVAEMRAALVAAIKAEARRRILARYPDWKQANMAARAAELAHDRGELTAEAARAELEAIAAGWAEIRAIRLRSNILEAALPATAAGLAAVDVTAGWD